MNLGSAVTEAAGRLKGNEDWEVLRVGLGDYATNIMNTAIASPVDVRTDATAYARGVRDTWIAFEAATAKVAQNLIRKPGAALPVGAKTPPAKPGDTANV